MTIVVCESFYLQESQMGVTTCNETTHYVWFPAVSPRCGKGVTSVTHKALDTTDEVYNPHHHHGPCS